jgi:hypothetical protein
MTLVLIYSKSQKGLKSSLPTFITDEKIGLIVRTLVLIYSKSQKGLKSERSNLG